MIDDIFNEEEEQVMEGETYCSLPLPEEEHAASIGGMSKFYEYLAKNMQYPRLARKAMIEGRVFVQFVVSPEGILTDFKVLKGIGGGCDKEAIRVLKKAPPWKPAKQRGRPVTQRIAIPVFFQLR
ncbi:energy transducer TonB [Rapidithrix thailandica]|uniref:Energy transducer TonB n=1 Tax=Rapidithrix thailandica TaxID=413964 RepID=A0AAW9SBN3_9BACT